MLPNIDADTDQLVKKGRAEVSRGLERIKGQGASAGQQGPQLGPGQGGYQSQAGRGQQYPQDQGGPQGVRQTGYPPDQSQPWGQQQHPQPQSGVPGQAQGVRQSELGGDPTRGAAGVLGGQDGQAGQTGAPPQVARKSEEGAAPDVNQPGGQVRPDGSEQQGQNDFIIDYRSLSGLLMHRG